MVHSKERPKKFDSTKVQVGEIDTRAPFQSVKDAVNLFGEVAFSGEKDAIKKSKPHSTEKPLIKETERHLAQKELNKLKEQLRNAENTKAEALVELERAKLTVADLSQQLKLLTESKEAAIRATEATKKQAKLLKESNNSNLPLSNGFHQEDSENSVEEYPNVLLDLNVAKQELSKIRQDYESSLEEKETAMEMAAEAEIVAKENVEKKSELLKEISSLKETMEEVEEASAKAQREQANVCTVKDAEKKLSEVKLEETAKKLEMVRKNCDPEIGENLEGQLAEEASEVEVLRKELEEAKATDLDSEKTISSELDSAKKSLQGVVDEENVLVNMVDSLKLELENLKKEHAELKEKEVEAESTAGNLHVKLRKCKSELENAIVEESKATGASEEMIATLNQLALESKNARHESKEMKIKADELTSEAEATKISLKEAEDRLKIALDEAEEAKFAEAMTLGHVSALSEQANKARCASTLELGTMITISRDEFDTLSRKVEESEKLTEMKVAAVLAQIEVAKAGKNEAFKKLEASRREIADMKAATEEAFKKAEMAEAAKKAVEGELQRWREKEEKKALKILEETEVQLQPRIAKSGPVDYKIHSEENAAEKGVMAGKKLEKQRSSFSRRALLPSLSGMFSKKKSQVERGSPSNHSSED